MRDERLARLIDAISVVYDLKTSKLISTSNTVVLSESYEIISSYSEKDQNASGGAQGLPTICDEFTVQVGLDDSSFTSKPVFDVTTPLVNAFWMEYLSPKVPAQPVSATTIGIQRWAIADTPTDFGLAANNGYGTRATFVPGSRTVRFNTTYNMTTAPVPAGSLVMSVVGRVRNQAATKMLLDRIEGRIDRLEGMIEAYGGGQAVDLARNGSRFTRHEDPIGPLLFPSTLRR